jgi:hypothetical protein
MMCVPDEARNQTTFTYDHEHDPTVKMRDVRSLSPCDGGKCRIFKDLQSDHALFSQSGSAGSYRIGSKRIKRWDRGVAEQETPQGAFRYDEVFWQTCVMYLLMSSISAFL